MGDASTLSSTSSSPGTGRAWVTIDSSITPSSVKVERSSLALFSDIRTLSSIVGRRYGVCHRIATDARLGNREGRSIGYNRCVGERSRRTDDAAGITLSGVNT